MNLRALTRALLSAVLIAALAACETTGGGTIITDTGKARADRERMERDTRFNQQPKKEQHTAAAAEDSAGREAGATDSTPPAAPESEDAAMPATTVLPDAGGALAVLVDVVRPSSTAPDSYDPVADSELSLVQIARADAGVETQRGVALTLGDEITTGADTVAVLNYPPNIEIYVMPNTQVRIGSIFVKLGEIWVSIKGALKEKFKVETEFVTAGVEGTEFLFRAQPDGAVDVDVLKGAVLCTSKSGRWAPLRMRPRENFFVRRDVAPRRRALASAEIARVQARVRPVNVAVATKLGKARVIPLDKQIYTTRPEVKTPLPAADPEVKPDVIKTPEVYQAPGVEKVPEGSVSKPPSSIRTRPEIKSVPDSVITKPPASSIPTKPDVKSVPNSVITKPPAAEVQSAPVIKSLPSTTAPMSTKPKSTTAPIRSLPNIDQDAIKAR